MNVIANNCCGGWLYTHNKIEYNNPFMWSITQYDSIIYLLTHFYDINWTNIQLLDSPLRNKTYQIIVDKHVAIHYIHCLFNQKEPHPTKVFRKTIGNDIDYCRIWEYVYEKYITRVRRMISCGENPSFLLRPNDGNCKWDREQINNLLTVPTPFKRILITTIPDIVTDNVNNLIIHTSDYKSHSDVVKSHLSEINKFIGFC